MGGLLFYLLGVWIGSAHGPGALSRQLEAAIERGHVPLDYALELAPDLALTLHQRRSWSMAAYVPPSRRAPDHLALYAPFYLRGHELVGLVDMPVDVCEHYVHALLEAHLRRQLAQPATPVARAIRERAPAAMPDVPRERQVEAYVDALASFGSHLLSVANELERKDEQRRDRGGLCPLLDRPLPLIALWDRMFTSEAYPGSYEGPGGRVLLSRSVLASEDKRFLLDAVLRSPWKGRVREDLGPRYCRG